MFFLAASHRRVMYSNEIYIAFISKILLKIEVTSNHGGKKTMQFEWTPEITNKLTKLLQNYKTIMLYKSECFDSDQISIIS